MSLFILFILRTLFCLYLFFLFYELYFVSIYSKNFISSLFIFFILRNLFCLYLFCLFIVFILRTLFCLFILSLFTFFIQRTLFCLYLFFLFYELYFVSIFFRDKIFFLYFFISNFFFVVQSAAWCAESAEVKVRVLECGRSTGVQYRELLQLLLQATHRPSTEARQALSNSSRKIATCVTDLVAAAESLKGISILNLNSCPTNFILFLET